MYIILYYNGHIKIDHMAYITYIYPARCHICSHQYFHFIILKRVHRIDAGILPFISM